MKKARNLLFLSTLMVLASCVSQQRYVDARLHVGNLTGDSLNLAHALQDSRDSSRALQSHLDALGDQNRQFQEKMDLDSREDSSRFALQQRELQGAHRTIAGQQKRLSSLESLLRQQREAVNRLKNTISDALVKFKSDELSVHIRNGKVYVSMQEKLLFRSASADVDPKGREALKSLAQVLNQSPGIDIDVEGHTDSIPIHGSFRDNWALSLARAASISRILIGRYGVDPRRITASGRSKYDPVESNASPQGRARNRRTEIILAPKLDELYRLITGPGDPGP